MNKPIVTVKEKKYFVSSVSVVLKLNSGPIIHLRLSNKLDGTENKLSNEETFKTEFFQDICQEAEGSFAWGGQTIKFILVGYNSSEARTFELVGLVVKKDVIDWFNQNNFKEKKQDYLIYQKSNGVNNWLWLNKVLGDKFAPPNPDFVEKVKLLFPDNACIWRYRDANNFHFLNRTIAFASRHLPEAQGWCAFDADKPLRLILFEEKKQDNSIPKLDQTWNPSHLFLPNRYSWNRWLDRSCTLSRDISINTGQEIALIKQLVSDGSNGEDAQKGKNFQAQNPTRLLFSPGTINIGDRNIFCQTVSYEFKLPAFEEKESPSVTMKIEMDYPERQIGDNEVVSLRLQGKFQKWEKEKDEETKVKIAPPDLNNWGIIDEKDQSVKSGNDAVLYTQILSPTYSDKKYSGIYIKHEKDDEMIVDIHPCCIPLVLGSVQKYRKELEKADVTLSGQKLAISVSEHYQSLDNSEAIILDNSEIKLNHGKKVFVQAQQKVDFLSKNIELGSSQIEINSGQAKINSLLNVSFPSPKVPTPNVPSSPATAGLASGKIGGGSNNSAGSSANSSSEGSGATSSGDSSSNNNVNSKGKGKGKQRATSLDKSGSDTQHDAQEPVDKEARAIQNYMRTTGNIAIRGTLTPEEIDLWSDNPPTRDELPPNYRNMDKPKLRGGVGNAEETSSSSASSMTPSSEKQKTLLMTETQIIEANQLLQDKQIEFTIIGRTDNENLVEVGIQIKENSELKKELEKFNFEDEINERYKNIDKDIKTALEVRWNDKNYDDRYGTLEEEGYTDKEIEKKIEEEMSKYVETHKSEAKEKYLEYLDEQKQLHAISKYQMLPSDCQEMAHYLLGDKFEKLIVEDETGEKPGYVYKITGDSDSGDEWEKHWGAIVMQNDDGKKITLEAAASKASEPYSKLKYDYSWYFGKYDNKASFENHYADFFPSRKADGSKS